MEMGGVVVSKGKGGGSRDFYGANWTMKTLSSVDGYPGSGWSGTSFVTGWEGRFRLTFHEGLVW